MSIGPWFGASPHYWQGKKPSQRSDSGDWPLASHFLPVPTFVLSSQGSSSCAVRQAQSEYLLHLIVSYTGMLWQAPFVTLEDIVSSEELSLLQPDCLGSLAHHFIFVLTSSPIEIQFFHHQATRGSGEKSRRDGMHCKHSLTTENKRLRE